MAGGGLERLGGQVYSLDPRDDPAAKQALVDASERYTAAGSQVEQAKSVQQYRLAQQTAYEGLYYVHAARTSLGLDPGPELPPIPGQQLPAIFEPFQRGSNDRQGLGLGLFIVRAIVSAHGGTVEALSSAAAGTQFTLRLPRAAARSAA